MREEGPRVGERLVGGEAFAVEGEHDMVADRDVDACDPGGENVLRGEGSGGEGVGIGRAGRIGDEAGDVVCPGFGGVG